MPFRWDVREHVSLLGHLLKWTAICIPLAGVVGSAVALFLISLEWVTQYRFGHSWLLYLLPVGGVAIGLVYHYLGRSVEAGNNLIVEQIHHPGGGVPARMAPLVLVGTLVTHLFGGSAGREGTAVQMGGSIASTYSKVLKRIPLLQFGCDEKHHDLRLLLMAGVACGFGAVFGTPLAGAVFAMEVIALGRMTYEGIIPCLLAAIMGDWVCTAWGAHHTNYHLASLAQLAVNHSRLDWALLGKVAAASAAFGLASVLFAEMTHGLQWAYRKVMPYAPLRPAVGGVVVIALTLLLGRIDYLGLGTSAPPGKWVVTISTALHQGGADPWSWWWKLLFTAVTLGAGFKGGEVTPLFFIGATLGNTLAQVMHVPPEQFELLPALGFVAVFAGATNTPLACTLMGVELFGASHVVYIATACFLSYLFSGHSGIYGAQRIGVGKALSAREGETLAKVRERRSLVWRRRQE